MNLKKNKKLRLLIISHVIHYEKNGHFYAYTPYQKEIDIWAEIFSEILIASPLKMAEPPSDCDYFRRKNIRILPILERGGQSIFDKFRLVLSIPKISLQLIQCIRQVDAIHVRCPGNLGLMGIILSPFFKRIRVAKYAGQWQGYPGESFTVKLQRWLLKSKWWNAPVLVYGEWPNQPAHIISFFTSILSNENIGLAKESALLKKIHNPIRILYVGRLSQAKNVDTVLKSVRNLLTEGIKTETKIIGQGDQLEFLQKLTDDLLIKDNIEFLGGIAFEEVLKYYEWADILVLVSETEGWPKAITEAMAFGVVCIGSNRGLVPQILGDGRGIVIEPGDSSQLAIEINKLSAAPGAYKLISRSAAEWSQKYSISSLKNELKEVMKREWQIDFS